MTDRGVMNESSETLRAQTSRQDGYDRYDLTLFFDQIRRRLSASNPHFRFNTFTAIVHTEWQ